MSGITSPRGSGSPSPSPAGGYLEPFGSATSVPDDQLFYSGGAFTVRGYDENRLYYDSAGNGLGDGSPSWEASRPG